MLLPQSRVDAVVVHTPESCTHCGHSLEGAEEGAQAQVHQTVELPRVRAEVKEHRMRCLRCPKCSGLTRAPLPEGGKHFGSRLSAAVGVLAGHYRMSRRSVTDLLGRLLDVPALSLGSTDTCTQETSTALEAAYEAVQAEVRASSWAAVDETSWKLCGKKRWLWTAVAEQATVFRISAGRGAKELQGLLGDFGGTVSSDRWCAYQIYPRRQICLAHLIRSCRKVALRGGKAAEFGAKAEELCKRVFKQWRQCREGKLTRNRLKCRMKPIQAALRRLVEEGSGSINQKVASACRNLLKLWPSLWTFLDEPIEPTNNAAERALRKAVLWRKGCFGNQSENGLRYAERILSISATCQQQGIHPLDFVADSIAALRAGSPAPTILRAT